MNLALICVGAGRGVRYGSDKLAERLDDRSVLAHTVEALHRAFPESRLVVVAPPQLLERWRDQLSPSVPGAMFVSGGDRRQDSVRAGVEVAADDGADVALVHDAARPLLDSQDAKGVVWALGDAAGAVLCRKLSDTVKRVDDDGFVLETVSRDELRLAITPQVFRIAALYRAWDEADVEREWTDEAAMLESIGMPIRSVVATRPSPKLTTAEDLELIRALYRATT